MRLFYPFLFSFAFIILLCPRSFSQSNDCGNNAGFENGTVGGWICKYGSYGSGACPTSACPAFDIVLNNNGALNPLGVNAPLFSPADRHVIVTGAGTDPNSLNTVPVVAPGGGNYSFRLGNANTGGTTDGYAQAESARLTFMVTAQNAGFTYRYAAFIEDPGHLPEEQPRFEISVMDAQDNLIPCGYYKVVAGSSAGCPGTGNFLTGYGSYKYTNWTNVGLDLTGYIGQNISIEFRTADCYPGTGNKSCFKNGPGSHSAYAYIDAYCQPLAISAPIICTNASSVQICAPAGYLSYSWPAGQAGITGSPTTQCVTINNPVAGTVYHVNMISVTGCPTSTTVALQGVSATVRDTTLCNGTGNISLNVTPVTPGTYSYSWVGPSGFISSQQNPSIPIPSQTSTYSVTLTSSAGCMVSKILNVNVLPKPSVTISPNISLCLGNAATLSASGGLSYSWSPSIGLNNAGISNPLANLSTTTTFTVSVTGANNCKSTATTSVTVNPLPVISITPPLAICSGASVQLSATGGTVYSWVPSTGLNNSGIANPVSTPSSTTAYTVTVITANGCVNKASTSVNVNSFATVYVIKDSGICIGSGIQLTSFIASAASYSWSSSIGGVSNPNVPDPFATPTTTTSYTITATDVNGCKGNATTTVTVNPLPIVTISPSATACLGSPVQLSSSGGIIYSWTPSTGLSDSTISNPTATPANSTTYSVIVSDVNGCSGSQSVGITINPLPLISISPDVSICNGSVTQLTSSGGSVYSWSPSVGLDDPNISNPLASPSVTTTYSLSVADLNSCIATSTVTVTVIPFITVNVSADTSICNGSVAQLSSSGGITYSWLPMAGLSDPYISNPLATPSVTTTYSVHITDASGCSGNSSIVVTVNQLANINISPDVAICSGSSVQLTSLGGISYLWTPSAGLSDSAISNPVATPLATTIYTLTITDANGCRNTANVKVSIPGSPVANASSTNVSCYGSVDGAASTAATGGVPNYSYSWNTGASTSSINGLSPGTYSVTVTDSIGCTGISSVVVNEPPPMVLNFPRDYYICDEGAGVTLTASGGTSYLWTPGADLSDSTIADPYATPYITTTYTVTVSNGSCFDTAHVTVHLVSAPAPPIVTQSGDTLFVPQGFISYQWYYEGSPIPGANSYYYLAIQSGHYSVYLTDKNGCRVITSSTFIITSVNPDPLDNKEIVIYPNPAAEELWIMIPISSGGLWVKETMVELYNVLGECVYRSQLITHNTKFITNIDVSSLSEGIYTFRILSGKESINKKIMILRK